PAEAGRVPAALAARAERVLEAAAAGGHGQLVLGAWGCGVFRNEPADVAGAFAAALLNGGRFAGRFDRVVFAVLDRREDSPTRAAFAEVF
ncbi:TIGR02452 family protein, partial [Streptomyces inhibens]